MLSLETIPITMTSILSGRSIILTLCQTKIPISSGMKSGPFLNGQSTSIQTRNEIIVSVFRGKVITNQGELR